MTATTSSGAAGTGGKPTSGDGELDNWATWAADQKKKLALAKLKQSMDLKEVTKPYDMAEAGFKKLDQNNG